MCWGRDTELEGSQTSVSVGLCYKSLPFSHRRKHSALRLGPQAEDPGSGSWKGEWESLSSEFHFILFSSHTSHTSPVLSPTQDSVVLFSEGTNLRAPVLWSTEDILVVWSKEGTGTAIIRFSQILINLAFDSLR